MAASIVMATKFGRNFYGTICKTFDSAVTGKKMVSINLYGKDERGFWFWTRNHLEFTEDETTIIKEFPATI
jgi:hypothetical protein